MTKKIRMKGFSFKSGFMLKTGIALKGIGKAFVDKKRKLIGGLRYR